MVTNGKRIKLPIRITVGGMFVIATILTATIAIFLQYHFTKEMAKEHVMSRYANASAIITDHISQLDKDATYTAELFSEIASTHFEHSKEIMPLAQTFAKALRANKNLYSIYIGTDDESFLQLINLNAANAIRDEIGALAEDRWALITHLTEATDRIARTQYLNDAFEVRTSTQELSNYYPTQRAWYQTEQNTKVYKTEPYLFHNLKLTGQTYSKPLTNQQAVLGVDIVLSAIAKNISENIITTDERRQAEAYIFSESGEVIASNQILEPAIAIPQSRPLNLSVEQQQVVSNTRNLTVSNQNDWTPIDFTLAGRPKGYAIDLFELIQRDTGLTFEYINGRSWSQLVNDFQRGSIDILHSIQNHNQDLGLYSAPLYQLPFSLLTTHSQSSINALGQWGERRVGMIEGWSIIPKLKATYPNLSIITYSDPYRALEALEAGSIDGFLESHAILKHILTKALHSDFQLHTNLEDINRDFPNDFYLVMDEEDASIIDIINLAINNISKEQRVALEKKWLDVEFGQPNAAFAATVPYKELISIAEDANQHNKLHLLTINGISQYVYVTLVGEAGGFEEFFSVVLSEDSVISGARDRVVTSILITAGVMVLLLPLAWVFGTPIVTPITQLQQETQKIKNRQYDDVEYIDTPIKEVWQLSSSIHDMAGVIKAHEAAQEEFIESTIKVIAEAIDDKSPYTAGHCNRVPELGIMLAEALEKTTDGPFKDFAFLNDDERREFRIAAWLHDCGKITTPEHIIDKGSKLEANYNRIHEIRMRFEVLWRDAEIATLKQIQDSSSSEQKQQLIAQLATTQQQLTEDFTFIAKANVGGEYMSDDKIERVKQIANQTWTRYFDNRLGLSPIEDLAVKGLESNTPSIEPLLVDRPEHIIPRTRSTEFDPKLNINIKVPEHQYNLGEVYNLTISRGTLTDEDRYKINEHMISGIKMLERLPFPPELSRVPRYASTHHETLKGTGYPRKLTAEQLSTPERILVIADIFEALTAADRPYKKAKPLSVAVDIMSKMALDEHFDMELFKFFLTSGTYLKYAETYLPAEQIDQVDIEKYL